MNTKTTDVDDDADLLLEIAKARAKEEQSISVAATATVKAAAEGVAGSIAADAGDHRWKQTNPNVVAPQNMIPMSTNHQPGINKSKTKKNHNPAAPTPESSSSQSKNIEDLERHIIKNHEDESGEFDILNVVRQRQRNSVDIQEILYEKETEMIAPKYHSDNYNGDETHVTDATNHDDDDGNDDDDDAGTGCVHVNTKKTNDQQEQSRSEGGIDKFNIMDVVLKRAALGNNVESNTNGATGTAAVVPEPAQPMERQQHRPSSSGNSTAAAAPPPRPGAFSGAPGQSLRRRDDMRFSLVGAVGGRPFSQAVLLEHGRNPTDGTTNNIEPLSPKKTGDSEGLTEATPIDEDGIVLDVEAQPFDVATAEKKKLQGTKKDRKYYGGLVLAIVCILVAGGILGAVFRKNKEKNIGRQVFPPTEVPSLPPSDSPSFAPSGALDMLLDNLPEYTLASLERLNSPQWKAWEWLRNHRNITQLEEWRKKQLFALATFFFSFQGFGWNPLIKNRWLDDDLSECMWFSTGYGSIREGLGGLVYYYPLPDDMVIPSCNDAGEFHSLFLLGLQISGYEPVLPPEISLLSGLYNIILMDAVYGPIPSEMGMLTNMTRIWLGNGNLKSLPTELGLMTRMSSLRLRNNSLTGTVPSELGLLSSMTDLQLSDNNLSGSIPSELGRLHNMTRLSLENNGLSGALPSALGLLRSITHLQLSNNNLSGSIPSELGRLHNVTRLSLKNNGLSGALPPELARLEKLEILDLANNLITGTIPLEFDNP